jgi:hypothetical protein
MLPRHKKTGSGGLMGHFAHAKWLRERAADFRRAAKTIEEQHTKESFLTLARSYEVLADAEEGVGTGKKSLEQGGTTDA